MKVTLITPESRRYFEESDALQLSALELYCLNLLLRHNIIEKVEIEKD